MPATGPTMPKVKALLFDLGGVVVDIHPGRIAERWAQHAKCNLSELNWSFTPDEDYFRYELGKISYLQYLSILRARMKISISDAEMLDGWNNIFGDVVPGVPDLLETAKKAPSALYIQQFQCGS
jgi:putative hydrolase of the HAD superfamily